MRPSTWIKRLAAFGLLLVVLWFGWTAVVVPMLDCLALDQESIANSMRALAHYHEQAASKPDLERRRAALLSTEGDKDFLQGKDPSAVAAEMQATARRLITSSGAVIRVSRTLPGADEDRFWKGEVAFELQASAANVTRLLHMLAGNQPAILVERLAIRTAEDSIDTKAGNKEPILEVELRLAAYALFGNNMLDPK